MLLIPTTVNEWSYLKISINKICAYESGMMISLSGLRVVAAPSRTCEAISGAPSQALLSGVGVTPASYQDGGLGWGARGNDGLQLASAPGLSWTEHLLLRSHAGDVRIYRYHQVISNQCACQLLNA